MPMPMSEVVPQVHRLARRAKAKKKLTFTNVKGEDLGTLYADLPYNEDDLELTAQPAEVGHTTNNDSDDGEDKEADSNEDDSDYEDEGSDAE